MLPTARTTSKRCGAAATCCASRARMRPRSRPRDPGLALHARLEIQNPGHWPGFLFGRYPTSRAKPSPAALDRDQARRGSDAIENGRARRIEIGRIKAAPVRHHFEAIGEPDHGLRGAKD